MHVGVVKVLDPRLPVLAEIYHPRKVVYPEIKYWDLPQFEAPAKSQGSAPGIEGQSRNILQSADAFLLVLREFTNPAVVHPFGSTDLARDLESVLGDLTLADLVVLDRVCQRLEDRVKKAVPAERQTHARQLDVVQKVKQAIEDGVPLRDQQLTASEQAALSEYQLLTGKPVIVAVNTDESALQVSLEELGVPLSLTAGLGQVSLCAKLESDLVSMTDEEAEEFRTELGLAESAMSPGDQGKLRNRGPGVFPHGRRGRSARLERVGGYRRPGRGRDHPYRFFPWFHPGRGDPLRPPGALRQRRPGQEGGRAPVRGQDLPGPGRRRYQLPGQRLTRRFAKQSSRLGGPPH